MKNLESVRECESMGRKVLCDLCRKRIESAIAERDAMLHALECIWAGVPDSVRKTLGEEYHRDGNDIVVIAQMVAGLRKVRDILRPVGAVEGEKGK